MKRIDPAIIRSITALRDTGMQVGCKRDAYRAAIGDLSHSDPHTGRDMRGLQRSCFIDDKGTTVYKVANPGWDNANRLEFEQMYRELADAGLTAFRTPCALFILPNGQSVLAMPYRPQHGRALSQRAEARLHAALRNAQTHGYFVPDMHEGNYRGTPAGRPKITDLGFAMGKPYSPSTPSPSTPSPSTLPMRCSLRHCVCPSVQTGIRPINCRSESRGAIGIRCARVVMAKLPR